MKVPSALTWWWLRRVARAEGIDPRTLTRVEAYLRGTERRDVPPLQWPLQWFPGLTAKPWHDTGDFPWTARLEAAHEAIRVELREVQPLGFLRHHEQGLDERGSWTTYRLFASGRKLEEQCRRCPETTRIVESIPDVCATGLVYFSVLSPGTHLAAHCGPTNTRLRCHLGLVVPPGSRIRVGEETRAWEEGRCIVFDDSFEHEAWNESAGERIVLIVDIWHPDLTPSERWALDRVVRASPRARAYARSASR